MTTQDHDEQYRQGEAWFKQRIADLTGTTLDADGKLYGRRKREDKAPEPEPDWEPPRSEREPVHPWAAGGDVGRALRKVWSAMGAWSPDTVRKELSDREWSETRQLIAEATDAATRWLQEP